MCALVGAYYIICKRTLDMSLFIMVLSYKIKFYNICLNSRFK